MNRLTLAILLTATAAFTTPATLANKTLETVATPACHSAKVAKVNRSAELLTPTVKQIGDVKKIFAAHHPRVILALGGGACKCLAEIGVIRSLERNHIPIDGIVGTSLGSAIGALYCTGYSCDDIEKMFLDKQVQKAIMSGLVTHYLFSPLAPVRNLVAGKPYAGILNGRAYERFLAKNLPASFSDLKIPFAAVATDLTDGQTCVFAKGSLPQAVLASGSVPKVCKPVLIKGKLYVDGGLRSNLPTDIAQSLGAPVVVAVLCDQAITPEANKKFQSGNNVVLRATNIMLAAADHKKANDADVLIYPNVDFVPAITKDPNVIKKAVAAGDKACDKVLAKIERQLAAAGTKTRTTAMKKPVSANQ
jgi:NTE family protein